MTNPKWGIKRSCQSCSCHFYDLNRNPIVCPKCSEVFDPDAFLKVKKTKASSEGSVDPLKRVQPLFDPEFDRNLEDTDVDSGDDELMEDPSDLDVGDDDVSDVIEHVTLDEQ